MQIANESSKELKINYTAAMSTAVLALVAIIGLMFAVVELIETKILSSKIAILILVFIFLGLFTAISIIKRWIKK